MILLCTCYHNDDEFTYTYKITRITYSGGINVDSTVFYYDQNDRLVRKDDCYIPGSSCVTGYPIYEADSIVLHGNVYKLDDQGNIESFRSNNSEYYTAYTYVNDRIVYEQTSLNGNIIDETFYQYIDGRLLKDSTIVDQQWVTVHTYISTDTLAPHFFLDESDYKEFPLRSAFLIKESIDKGENSKNVYKYDISENQIIIYHKSIDIPFADTIDRNTIKFVYEMN